MMKTFLMMAGRTALAMAAELATVHRHRFRLRHWASRSRSHQAS